FFSDLCAQQEDITQLNALKDDFPWIENQNNNEISFLPKLWNQIRKVKFEDFHAFYNKINNNLDKYPYPFILVYLNHYEKLKLIKNLRPIVKFVKYLNCKLEFSLTRKLAQTMTFNDWIEKESINNVENGNYLKSSFEKFASGW